MGRSVCDPVLRATHPEDREVLAFAKEHPHQPPSSYSCGAARVAHPRRRGSTLIGGDGGLFGTPRPRTSPPTPRYLNNREVIRTLGVTSLPLSGPPADGLPFPGASDHVAYDACTIRRRGDDQVGSTVPRLVEGGNN